MMAIAKIKTPQQWWALLSAALYEQIGITATLLVLMLGISFCGTAKAEIYRTVDASGNVVFTDRPPKESSAEPVQLKPSNQFQGEVVRKRQQSLLEQLKQEDKERQQQLQAQQQSLAELQQQLQLAKAELDKAKQITGQDIIANANGTTRKRQSYYERVDAAKAVVEKLSSQIKQLQGR